MLTAEYLYSLPIVDGWRRSNGKRVALGDEVTIGDGVTIADRVTLEKTPLQIKGSRHSITVVMGEVQIGCLHYSIQQWLAHYESIGKMEGYSPEEIEEYGKYLVFIDSLGS